MARFTLYFALAAALVAVATADMYMQNPRGGNNRLDEANRNRNNANRLFDSQNNNKGGYNVGYMYYYEGSILQLEWTNQHSCGGENNHCELVWQYMCDMGDGGTGIRDGYLRTTIDTDYPDNPNYGRHESGESYAECQLRQRNMGLFLADQDLNDDTAEFTRQNTNGNRHGFECPEERDYYPYWHPTEWKDAVIFTNDVARCEWYQAESQNVKNKGHCTGNLQEDPNDPNKIITGAVINNREECQNGGFTWMEDGAWGIDPPACERAAYSRDNHLGNGVNGYANSYEWTVPRLDFEEAPDVMRCVLRVRYNISTKDYDRWTTDYTQNEDAGADPPTTSPIQNNPTITVGQDGGTNVDLKLALNTDQYGRTFQDRSHSFLVKKRPSGVGKGKTIYNLNVRGCRGNIVQTYPATEYDFVPNQLAVTKSTFIHVSWTGSNTTPDGAGQGRAQTDRHNMIQIRSPNHNEPLHVEEWTLVEDPTSTEGIARIRQLAMMVENPDNEQDNERPYQDMGLLRLKKTGQYHYMSSRTHNFTNRSQKATITVMNGGGEVPYTLIGAIGGGVVGAGLIGAGVYGVAKPDSAIGGAMGSVKGKFSRGGSSFPQGYTRGGAP